MSTQVRSVSLAFAVLRALAARSGGATLSEVARAVSNGQANVGLGVESAALAYGLGFQGLTEERYDLVIPADKWQLESVRALSSWLDSPQAKAAITNMGGYDTKETGSVTWVD